MRRHEENLPAARELSPVENPDKQPIQMIKEAILTHNVKLQPINAVMPAQSQPVLDPEKIKNDVEMGYVTCSGLTASGERCKRRARKHSSVCGLHQPKRNK